MMGLISAGYLLINVSNTLPDVESIKGVELKVPLRVYSAEGLLISEFGDERRKPLALEDTPANLVKAVLASEDDRFYSHRGIDFSGLVRAAISNFRTGETQQGASTITMQVARNFFLSPEKTYIRKLREVMLAFKLEQILTKNEILHLYLNKIFLGHRAYGFGAAAEVYYGRELHELNLAELAMLAGLPKAPSSNNPLRNPARAITRRNYVLNRMQQLGHISKAEFTEASGAAVTASKHARKTDLAAPHIAEMVRAQLLQDFGEEAYWAGLDVHTTILAEPQRHAETALRAGLKAYDKRHGFRGSITSFDLDDVVAEEQETIEIAYDELLAAFPDSREQKPVLVTEVDEQSAQTYSAEFGFLSLTLESSKWARRHLTANSLGETPQTMREVVNVGDVVYVESFLKDSEDPNAEIEWRLSQIPNVSGALISIEPNTGRILSLVGGYDFFLNKYNRAIQSIRQPGSNIKPFIYSAALDRGLTPASLISGAPIVMTDPTHGTVWRPENYSGKFFGPTRMREALAKSMNLVSIRLLRSIGIPYAREYLERFGIDMSRFGSSLTMALGSGGITPLELLSAYGVIANSGYRVNPYFIERIVDRDGEIIFRAPTPDLCDACYSQFLPEPEPTPDALEGFAENSTAPRTEAETIDELSAEELAEPEVVDLSEPRSYEAPRVMNRANNFLLRTMMQDVIQRGTARKALVLERDDLAGKTGTTNDYVDAWFTGFNSKIATTVWIGFDDPRSMGRGEAGSKAALPIWIDYMRHALRDVEAEERTIPDYIEPGWVNRATGQRTDELDPSAIEEFFPIEALLPEPFGELGLPATMPVEEFDEDGNLLELEDQNELEEFEPIPDEERILESEEETEGLF